MRLALLPLLLVLPLQAQGADVRILMSGDAPDDLAHVLETAKSAEKRLWLFAYTLSDKGLIEILAEKAKAPEFDLRILIDSGQLKKNSAQLEPLLAKLTPIVVPDEGRLHTKLMLVDGHTIFMGSKNWSNLGSLDKWNDVVQLRGKKLVRQVEKAFQRVGGFKSKPLKTELPDAPDATPAKVELLFSAPGNPGTRTRAALVALLAKARKRIHVGMFILSDSELVKALWLRRGQVEIRIVIDAIQQRNLGKRVDAVGKQIQRQFKDLGASVRLCSGKQLHHKLALIDDVVVTGSANWSKAAWATNHEVLAILRPEKRKQTPRFVETYRARLEALWAQASP